MDLGLKGKKVIITGATQGIGFSTAKTFIKEGAEVLITGRSSAKLEKVRKELPDVITYEGNLINESEITKFKNVIMKKIKWTKVDILVPNIGSGKPETDDNLDINEWDRLYGINLRSAVHLVHEIKDMISLNGASIVFISSITASQVFGKSIAYAASKNAIITLTKYLARDYAAYNIRVNAIQPGNIFFEGGRWDELYKENPKGIDEMLLEIVPLKRFGLPKEVADAIVYLSSERASFITGQVIAVDGGQLNRI